MNTKHYYAIGDIHGCMDKLLSLMDNIRLRAETDTLVFLGDYIDRGPNSYEVVEYLIELQAKYPKTIFLKGNHEEMLEKYLEGPDRYTYLVNGGQITLENYLIRQKPPEPPIPETHLNFFNSLYSYYETDQYIFVHAGLREHVPLEDQSLDDLFWIREGFIESRADFGKQIIFGHTPFPEPLVHPNKIGIDTGAVYGNYLTCVKLPDMEFFHS